MPAARSAATREARAGAVSAGVAIGIPIPVILSWDPGGGAPGSDSTIAASPAARSSPGATLGSVVRTLDAISPGRMVAALVVALSFGAIVASLAGDGEPAGYAVLIAVLACVTAVAIAAVLLVPVVAARALQRRSPARPPGRVVAAALVVGGLIVLPVYSNFYDDAEFAAVGGGVGYCGGILPLAQVVHNSIADEPYGAVYYSASCDD